MVPSPGGIRGRLQQMLTRKRRPLTKDDFWAILSWLFVGHGAFLLAGTTTAASLALLVANSLQIQAWVACEIGQFLTRSTGVTVTFGSAEPNWKGGKLSFRDLRVVCGPPEREGVSENYTMYDLKVDRFDVDISLARLLEGRGLARSCSVSGLRGTVDRSQVRSVEGWRYEAKPGDFELDAVVLHDVLVTVLSDDFRPFSISVLDAKLPRLRKRFLMYDALCTESAVGVFDNCLFSLHTPKVEIEEGGRAEYDQLRHLRMDGLNVDHFIASQAVGPLSWLQRGTVDIHAFLQLPSNYRKPSEDLLDTLNVTLENIKENLLVSILKKEQMEEQRMPQLGTFLPALDQARQRLERLRQQYAAPLLERFRKRLTREVLNVDEDGVETAEQTASFFLAAKPNTLSFKFDLRLRNIRAHIPLQNGDLSLLHTALAKPIVAYINEHRPYIPLSCRFQLDLGNFDGAWSVYESGIAGSLGNGVNDALAQLVADKNKRLQRLKRIGLWSVYTAVKNMGFVLGTSTPFSQYHNSEL